MVLDALRGYLQLASGVTEEPRQRAAAAARSLLSQGASAEAGAPGQLQQQVAALAEELVITSRANRELLLGLIRTEVERTLARLGIASADDVQAVQRRVDRLERLLRSQQASAAEPDEKIPAGGTDVPAASSTVRAGRATASAKQKTTAAGSRAKAPGDGRKVAASTTAGRGKSSATSSRRASRPAGSAAPRRSGGTATRRASAGERPAPGDQGEDDA